MFPPGRLKINRAVADMTSSPASSSRASYYRCPQMPTLCNSVNHSGGVLAVHWREWRTARALKFRWGLCAPQRSRGFPPLLVRHDVKPRPSIFAPSRGSRRPLSCHFRLGKQTRNQHPSQAGHRHRPGQSPRCERVGRTGRQQPLISFLFCAASPPQRRSTVGGLHS
jgi:hypothetical protein